MNVVAPSTPLKPKDFATDQEVRWCPGCGDYAILKAVQRTLADVGATRENTVFVSGIGCAARFPYYIETYGFHTIHGRAPAFATGIKLTNPDLDVWIATGDGDALSIGGNHMLHTLRRNIDVQILLFNNEIYGLTKGQYSPTSREGTMSPSTPQGSLEAPVRAAAFALGSGARFVARGIDTQQKQLVEVLKRAHSHKGASFVEIFQNCIVYNDGVYSDFTEKSVANEHQVFVKHGEPMIFGKDKEKGIRLKPGTLELEVVEIVVDDIKNLDILVHDETNLGLAMMLAQMSPPHMPMPIGVLYCDPKISFEESVCNQITQLKKDTPASSLSSLLRGGYTWKVS